MLHVDKDDLPPTTDTEVWDVDQGLISKLKEQYKKERKGKKGVKSKCRFYLIIVRQSLREKKFSCVLCMCVILFLFVS